MFIVKQLGSFFKNRLQNVGEEIKIITRQPFNVTEKEFEELPVEIYRDPVLKDSAYNKLVKLELKKEMDKPTNFIGFISKDVLMEYILPYRTDMIMNDLKKFKLLKSPTQGHFFLKTYYDVLEMTQMDKYSDSQIIENLDKIALIKNLKPENSRYFRYLFKYEENNRDLKLKVYDIIEDTKGFLTLYNQINREKFFDELRGSEFSHAHVDIVFVLFLIKMLFMILAILGVIPTVGLLIFIILMIKKKIKYPEKETYKSTKQNKDKEEYESKDDL